MAKRNQATKLLISLDDADSIDQAVRIVEGQRQFLSGFRTVVDEIAASLRQAVLVPMLRKLQVYPPERDGSKPIRWTSEKQRRAYFATDGFGKGIPYKRTNKLRDSWSVEAEVKYTTKGVLRIRVRNTSGYSEYVVGKIGVGLSEKSMSRYVRPKQRYHTDQGWQTAAQTIIQYTEQAQRYVDSEVQDRLVDGELRGGR